MSKKPVHKGVDVLCTSCELLTGGEVANSLTELKKVVVEVMNTQKMRKRIDIKRSNVVVDIIHNI